MTSVIAPYGYRGTVIRWVDGDTLDIEVDLGFRMKTTQRFRLLGVDTPERGQPNYREAREMAESLCPPGTELLFESMKSDKYGRWLVYIGSVRDALLSSGLAVQTPASWS